MKSKRAQSIAEYALLITVVAASISAMSLYFKRTVQAGIRVTVDRHLVEELGIIPLSGAASPGEQAQILGMMESDQQETGTSIPGFSRSQVQSNSETSVYLKNGLQTTVVRQSTTTKGSSRSSSTSRSTETSEE